MKSLVCLRAIFVVGTAVAVFDPASVRSETLLERGRYLVNGILSCGNCHTPKGPDGNPLPGKELSGGGVTFNTPTFATPSSNITPDRETGIGSWSDQDIKRALREGVRPDHAKLPGTKLAPSMPIGQYKLLTERDLDAVVAYLRSIPAIRNELPGPVYKADIAYMPDPAGGHPLTEEQLRDPVVNGRYLGAIGHCMVCHSPVVRGAPDLVNAFGKGGRRFGPPVVTGYPAEWKGSVAPNITSDKKSGLGDWSDADIKRAIAKGISRDRRTLTFPMGFPWLATLKESDLDALVAWLRTVPPGE
jgi:mono/diheme cytochrome c family protein